jgi:hypothetical protein
MRSATRQRQTFFPAANISARATRSNSVLTKPWPACEPSASAAQRATRAVEAHREAVNKTDSLCDSDRPVLRIEVHHSEDFVREALGLQAQIVFDRIRACEHVARLEAGAQDAQRIQDHTLLLRVAVKVFAERL